MRKLETIEYKGKEILYLDASNLNVNNIKEISEGIEGAKEVIRTKPAKSVLVITNVTNIRFNADVANIFKEYAQHNTPYVRASALVGVSGMQKVILSAVKTLTGRDYYLADTLEEAKDWIMEQ